MPTLYLTEQGASLCQQDGRLVVEHGGRRVFSVPVVQVDRVPAFGHVQLTPAAMGLLLQKGIEVSFLSVPVYRCVGVSKGDWFRHRAVIWHCAWRSVRVHNTEFALQTARSIVSGKIRNGRAVLSRYSQNHAPGQAQPLRLQLRRCAEAALQQDNIPALLGIEG